VKEAWWGKRGRKGQKKGSLGGYAGGGEKDKVERRSRARGRPTGEGGFGM